MRIRQYLWENNVLFVAKILGELACHQCYMQNPRVAQGSSMGSMTYSSQIIPKEVKRELKIGNMYLNKILQNIVVQTTYNRLKDTGIYNNLHIVFTWAK